jgi:hypothetical protein
VDRHCGGGVRLQHDANVDFHGVPLVYGVLEFYHLLGCEPQGYDGLLLLQHERENQNNGCVYCGQRVGQYGHCQRLFQQECG